MDADARARRRDVLASGGEGDEARLLVSLVREGRIPVRRAILAASLGFKPALLAYPSPPPLDLTSWASVIGALVVARVGLEVLPSLAGEAVASLLESGGLPGPIALEIASREPGGALFRIGDRSDALRVVVDTLREGAAEVLAPTARLAPALEAVRAIFAGSDPLTKLLGGDTLYYDPTPLASRALVDALEGVRSTSLADRAAELPKAGAMILDVRSETLSERRERLVSSSARTATQALWKLGSALSWTWAYELLARLVLGDDEVPPLPSPGAPDPVRPDLARYLGTYLPDDLVSPLVRDATAASVEAIPALDWARIERARPWCRGPRPPGERTLR